MPKKIDATLKTMLEESPEDWPVLTGLPRQPTRVVDADISTVSGAADKVLHVGGKAPLTVHLEFQSGRDASLPRRIHVYNALLEHRHRLPVRSVAILVSPRAEHSNLTGTYEQGLAGEPPYLKFRYQVIRVWQEKPERFLAGGRGLLPLAPISAVAEAEVPGIIQRIKKRLQSEGSHAGDLWTATNVLMGLRCRAAFIEQMLEGVFAMRESVTYRAIIREGRREGALEEARRLLLASGRMRFGQEDPATTETIEAISDIRRLEELHLAAIHAANWEELLATSPASKPVQPARRIRGRGRAKPNGKRKG